MWLLVFFWTGAKRYKQTGHCLQKENLGQLLLCVNKNSFSLNETLTSTKIRKLNNPPTKAVNSNFWKSDIYSSVLSNPEIYHTLQYPECEPNMYMQIIFFEKAHDHKVYVYDLSFYVKKSSCDVCVSVCLYVCLMSIILVFYFEASHWPSGHMTSSRPRISETHKNHKTFFQFVKNKFLQKGFVAKKCFISIKGDTVNGQKSEGQG